MGRVFVAGSINMDVVATADRHPKLGETVAGNAVHYFPGGKGANQAVASAKLGAPTTLIGRLGADAFGQQLRTFLAAQAVDLTHVKDTAEAHTGTAIITVAEADNTIVVVPGANALVGAEDVAAPLCWPKATSPSASSKSRKRRSARSSGARGRPARPRSSIPRLRSMFGKDLLDLVDILILNETELGFLTSTELRDSDDPARFIEAARSPARRRQDHLRNAGQARRAGADRWRGVAHRRPRREGGGYHRRRRLFCRRARKPACRRKIDPRRALAYANAAASICVQRMGAAPSMPTAAEVAACIDRRALLMSRS